MERSKNMLKYFVFLAIFLFAGLQNVSAQASLARELHNGLSSDNNSGYKWVSRIAHPMNTFVSGSCEAVGNNIFITINSKFLGFHPFLKIGVHSNGLAFDKIWIEDEDDYPEAFAVADYVKKSIAFLWNYLRKDQITTIEEICMTQLDNLKASQACLAMVNYYWWNYPSLTAERSVLDVTNKYDISCQRLLTEDDIRGMSNSELKLMHNWILARNGYIFESQEQMEYFSRQPWYKGKFTDFGDVYYLLSDVELTNLQFISLHEN